MTREEALAQEKKLVEQSFSTKVREILAERMHLRKNDVDKFMELGKQ